MEKRIKFCRASSSRLTVLFATVALIQNTNSSAKIKMFFFTEKSISTSTFCLCFNFWVCVDRKLLWMSVMKWFADLVVVGLTGIATVKDVTPSKPTALKINDKLQLYPHRRCHEKSISFPIKLIPKYVNSFPYQFPCLFYHIICVISVSSIQH